MKHALAIVLVLALAGCIAVPETRSVKSYYPVLENAERPKLDEMTPEEVAKFNELPAPVRGKIIGNSDKLMLYATKMEVKLDTYNEFAKAANQASDAALGIKGGK